MIPVGIAGILHDRYCREILCREYDLTWDRIFYHGVLLLLTLFIRRKERPIGYLDSFIIGIAQAIAVLPGISRSGATIATGMMLGNKKSDIAKFSFLMVLIPVIGANFMEMRSGDFTTEGHIILRNTDRFYHCIYFRISGLQMDDKPCKEGQSSMVCYLLYYRCCFYTFTGIECLLKKQLLLRRDRFYCSTNRFTGHHSTW